MSSEQILQDRITQAVDVIAREGRTYNAVAAEAALRREVSALYAALEAVKAENAELRKDAERIDWLDAGGEVLVVFAADKMRDAIDRAMARNPNPQRPAALSGREEADNA